MTEPTGAQVGVPTPSVGLTLPSSPALNAALDQLQAAKQAHRDEPSDTTREAVQTALAEVRYQRWIVRGGPGQTPTRATQPLHDRYASGDETREG